MNDVTSMRAVGGAATIDAATPAGAQTGIAPSGSPRFQDLIDRLQKLAAEQRDANRFEDANDLTGALQTAENGFRTAMDLRRQLEEAFQRHLR